MARILVVDDDDAVRAAIATMLEYQDYAVVSAGSGAAGIAALQQGGIDLALVDLMMPGMTGMQTIKALHALAPTLPIIAMSGFVAQTAAQDGEDYLATALKSGAIHNLQKPFRPRELAALIADCLTGSKPE